MLDFIVSNTADSGVGSLRWAIDLANNEAIHPGADRIIFDAGMFGQTIALTSGELLINSDVTIDGDLNNDGVFDITIDAGGLSRVVSIEDPAGTVELDGVKITGGYLTGYYPSSVAGAGIKINGGADVTIKNSVITNNETTNNGGGGIAIFSLSGGSLTVENSEISNNRAATFGGGIYGYIANVDVQESTISGNTAQQGGGIYGSNNDIDLYSSTVSGNTATIHGGGVAKAGSGAAIITASTIAENTANADGGGISIRDSSRVDLFNSTIAGNVALADGGGIELITSGTRLNIKSSIVAGNHAVGSSDGINNPNSAIISSSGSNITSEALPSPQGNDRVASDPSTLFAHLTTVDPDGTPGNGDEYVIADMRDNGGERESVAISYFSDALGRGSFIADARDLDGDGNTTEPLPYDIRGAGFDRLVGGLDIGAYEADQFFAGSLSGFFASVSIDENQPQGTVIYDVDGLGPGDVATDTGFTYAITSGNPDFDLDGTNALQIDANTGEISVLDADDFDRELMSSSFYNLFVSGTRASDGVSAPGRVTVFVQDVPEFTVDRLDDVTADDGQTTLREAIALADAASSSRTPIITFASSGTITLTQGELVIPSDMIIDGDVDGDGSADITISGGNTSQVIENTSTSGVRDVTLKNLIIRDGSATNGGGIEHRGAALHLESVQILNNTATAFGGGIWHNGSSLTITDSTISGNQSTRGGGLGSDNRTTLTITNSTISDNQAVLNGFGYGGEGGGLSMRGTATISQTTIADNAAVGAGGGIWSYPGDFGSDPSDLTLVHTTITGNTSQTSAGGVHLESLARSIENSIIAGNAAPTLSDVDDVSGVTTTYRGVNIFSQSGIGGGSGLVETDVDKLFAATATRTDGAVTVKGGSLADNGGPVETVLLRGDALNPALDVTTANGATDARGLNRSVDLTLIGNTVAGTTADVGAVELQPSETANKAQAVVETGSASLTNAQTTITLSRDFIQPVVFAKTTSSNEATLVTVRISDIQSGQFTVQLQEPPNEDGVHAAETISWAVFEAGAWQLADGTEFQVGTIDSNKLSSAGFEQVSFSGGLFDAAPVIQSQVQTLNGADFVVTRQRNETSQGFELTMQEVQGPNGGSHLTETIGWLAFEEGHGTWDGILWEAGQTPDTVNHTVTTESFQNSFSSAPHVLTSLSRFDGADPSSARVTSVNSSDFGVFVQEDTFSDVEVVHTTETVDYFAFSGSGVLSATDVLPVVAEYGTTMLGSSNRKIEFQNSFDNPVVFAKTTSLNGADPITVRLDNISGTGFSAKLQEPDYRDGFHPQESLSWFVVEAGRWELSDGTVLEAGVQSASLTNSTDFQSIDFAWGGFGNAPTVLSQVQTNSDSAWVMTRQDDISAAGFKVTLQEEEGAAAGHATEDIGWLAIAPATGSTASSAGNDLIASGRTGDSITAATSNISLPTGFGEAPVLLSQLSSTDGIDPATARVTQVSNNAFTVFAEEEASADAEKGHTTETVDWLALVGDGVLTGVASTNQVIAEVGTTSVGSLGATIGLSHNFINPVAFMLPPSLNEADPAAIRITDIQSNSIDVVLQEPSNEDGAHLREEVSWIVMEAGDWVLSDGTRLSVGTLDTSLLSSAGFESVSFDQSFDAKPAIISQVQTDNDSAWVVTRQRAANKDGFQISMQEEEATLGSGHALETLGWFAIERGVGNWDGNLFEAQNSGNTVTDALASLNFSAAFSDTPGFLAALASMDGSDPSALRYTSLDSNGVDVQVMEERSADPETGHTTEVVDWFAFEADGLLTGSEWL